MSICLCYHDEQNFLHERGVCYGTKEKEPCSCGGNPAKCDFYEEVREKYIHRCKEDCYWYREEQDMGAYIPYCDGKNIFPIDPKDCENCDQYHSKYKKTNADRIRAMTDDELAEWYWWMLHYVQGYTDSRVALREWLKQDYTTFIAQEYKKDLIDRLNREGITP